MSDNASGSQIDDIGTIKVEPDSNVSSTESPEAANTTSSTPEASNTEKELRENLIQNAVQFLSHENVRSTPLVKKIAFLESKGLTSDEIQEAMSRVTNANRTKVAPQSTKPILPARQPTNRPSYLSNTAAVQTPSVAAPVVYTQPTPQPPPPPPAGTSLWKVIIGTMIMTLGTVGGISLLFKHLTKNLPSTSKQGQPLLGDSNLPLSHNEPVNSNSQNSNNINNGNNFNQNNRNPVNNNNVIGNNNGGNGSIAPQQYSAKSISSNNVNNNTNNNNNSNNNKEKQKDPGIEKVDINELKNAITELQNTLRDIRLSETTRSPSLNTPSGYTVSTNQTPGNTNTQPRLNQNFSQTPLRSSSLTTATPNKPQLPLQQQQQHVYAPFTHQRATVSDIYQQMKNGEDIPGINKNIDDSPTNTSLPSPVSASSSKPWERRRNQKKDQYSTTPLRNSEPNVNSPSYLTNSQNLSSSTQLKIVEVDEEPQVDQGVENNVQLFESLENISTEEKKLE